MVLNDLELEIVATKAMRFSEKAALQYLKDKGFEISRRTYYYTLGHISAETRKRSFEIAKSFLEDHIQTCDELNNIKKMMYENYNKEDDYTKRAMILIKITDTMIPFISAYREATKQIIEKVKNQIDKEKVDLSTP